MALNVSTFKIETGMGQVITCSVLGHPLQSFLNEKEQKEFDEIGYSGRLNGKRIFRGEYLNSLGKGTFEVTQDKFDNGDFSEEFTISRAWINGDGDDD